MRTVIILGLQEQRLFIRRIPWILILVLFLSRIPSGEVIARAQEEQDADTAPADEVPTGEVSGEEASAEDSSQAAPSPSSNPEKQTVKNKEVYKIQVGDRVSVRIYPEDPFIKGAEMEVSSEGTIVLNLVGKITIQDLTILEAERKITEILAKDYLVDPVVVVEVAERVAEKEKKEHKKTLSILGQVQKPGSYDLPAEGKLTLLQLISNAGGFTDVANAKNIKIIRKEGGKTNAIHANAEAIIAGKDPDVELAPEDVVHVGESFF